MIPEIQFPAKTDLLFQNTMPDGRPVRYKVLHGGRGSTKSWSIARYLILCAVQGEERILCARETQTSIKESVHQVIKDQIKSMGFSDLFDIKETSISCPSTGSEFIFVGLRTDPDKVKSTEGVSKCWVEEAHKVSKDSWMKLIPTIRKPGSEILVSFNPDQESDETSQKFMPPVERPDMLRVEINYSDNPWFNMSPLKAEMEYDFSVDPETAHHVWAGGYRKHSQAQIFGPKVLKDGTRVPKYVVRDFTPQADWSGPFFGADWGFAKDPVALTKSWVYQGSLYVEYEAFGVGVELNEIPEFFETVPGALIRLKNGTIAPQQHSIRADSARPETIVHIADYGFNIGPASKWPGSVEDGIACLRSFKEIVLHPRVERCQEEFRLYSYKVDKVTGLVLPIVVDAWNHGIDTIRYAFEPYIKKMSSEMVVVNAPINAVASDLDQFESDPLTDMTGGYRPSNW